MSARILERAAACVWQASRRLLTGYRLTGAIDPFAYRTVAGATACGTPALERMAKGTLRLVREAELEMALTRHIDRRTRFTARASACAKSGPTHLSESTALNRGGDVASIQAASVFQ